MIRTIILILIGFSIVLIMAGCAYYPPTPGMCYGGYYGGVDCVPRGDENAKTATK
jgi:hypothetical protein